MQFADRGIIAETVYTILRNYYKLSAVIEVKNTFTLVGYVWLHYLKIPATELSKLKSIKLATIEALPCAGEDIIEFPEWIKNRLSKNLSETEIKNLSKAMEQQAPLTLRVNTLKMSVTEVHKVLNAEGIKSELTKFSRKS